GPVYRATLFRGASNYVLHVTIHHVAIDGWTYGLLLEEFVTLYAAYRDGREANLPDLPIQYADYSVWQQARPKDHGELEAHVAYWSSVLRGAPASIDLPLDRTASSQMPFRGKRLEISLSDVLIASLAGVCRRTHVTLFMVMLAGWKALLWRWTGA